MTAVPIEQVGRYSCPACSHRFATLPLKKAHLKSKHPKKGAER